MVLKKHKEQQEGHSPELRKLVSGRLSRRLASSGKADSRGTYVLLAILTVMAVGILVATGGVA